MLKSEKVNVSNVIHLNGTLWEYYRSRFRGSATRKDHESSCKTGLARRRSHLISDRGAQSKWVLRSSLFNI